jgi:error-prone DNA polymerase
VLGETYGIAVYQEQITQLAMALADFSAVEGDQLRKIISKKTRAQKLADYRQRFLAGGEQKGLSKALLMAIWEQILSFAGYSFCKPHSASYALVSCKSAWLKANYPAEFMAAVLSNQGGFYSPFAYLSEARRLGLEVLPPDINASALPYSGNGRCLRIGLMQLQGLNRRAAETLLTERERGGHYVGFRDFLDRVTIAAADVRLLIKAGCFDALAGLDCRPTLLWTLLQSGAGSGRDKNDRLFAEPAPAVPSLPPFDRQALLDQELETLGLLISCHPLQLFGDRQTRTGTVPAQEMHRWVGRHVAMVGWWITGKTVQDKSGRPMEFVSFEDLTGMFDANFFPVAYERFCRQLSRQQPFLLKGKVEAEFGVAVLNVEWAEGIGGKIRREP